MLNEVSNELSGDAWGKLVIKWRVKEVIYTNFWDWQPGYRKSRFVPISPAIFPVPGEIRKIIPLINQTIQTISKFERFTISCAYLESVSKEKNNTPNKIVTFYFSYRIAAHLVAGYGSDLIRIWIRSWNRQRLWKSNTRVKLGLDRVSGLWTIRLRSSQYPTEFLI